MNISAYVDALHAYNLKLFYSYDIAISIYLMNCIEFANTD